MLMSALPFLYSGVRHLRAKRQFAHKGHAVVLGRPLLPIAVQAVCVLQI